MLRERDLGFFLVVVVIVPLILLILRRKWRQSVARSEEVKRLLVSASEESSRVEFEAREAYYYTAAVAPSPRVYVSTQSYASTTSVSPLKPQYHCVVCFSPTTTRCSKCKAVRYCSGKCQVFHWRQGHKYECRPYVAVTQVNNVGGSSNRQGDHKDHSDNLDTELKSPLSYEGHPGFSSHTNCAGVTFENLDAVKSENGTTVSPARKPTGLRDNNQKTSSLPEDDTQSGTSSSSFWTDDGSNKSSSLSEPSTSSSGFWDGDVSNKESRSKVHDDFASGSVCEAEYGHLANHTTKVVPNSNIMDGFHVAKVIDESGLGSKKSNDITNLSKGVTNDGSNSSKPLTYTSAALNHKDGSADNDLPSSKFRESKNSPSDVPSHRASTAARHSKVTDKSNGSSVLNQKDGSADSDLPTSKFRESKNSLSDGLSHRASSAAKYSKVTDKSNESAALNHKDGSDDNDLPTSKFGESKNFPSDVPSHHASTVARHSKVTEKTNHIFCNESSAPDMTKYRDVVSSSTRASDTYLTTATSRNTAHSTKPVKVVSDDCHRITTCSSQLTEASKFREAKISPSDAPSHRSSAAARHLNVPEKSNGVFCNKSTIYDISKSKDVASSLPRASDTYQTTVTSRNISHSTNPVKAVDDDSHKITTCSSQLTEASRSGLKTSKLKVVDHPKPSKLSHQESLEGRSDPTHRYNFKGLFPYEMFIKLYNWKQVGLQPCGLKNCGNSCYANAVLQCLIHTPPLTAYLYEGLHSKACEKRGWCFTCEFEGLVMKAKDGISPLSPIHMLTHIENIGSNLGHGKEEDAHEFLRYVIEALQSVCIKESRKSSLNTLEEETTLIGLTFGGYLRSKIICIKCGGKSEQHERMMDLTIEIEGDIRTLEEALDKFTCTEILDGENKYKCNRCKSYEKAKKKFSLLEAPNVLTIALKRFKSGKFGKLNKSIHFPEILDMAPYVSGTSDKSPIYSLYGVVVHIDTMNAAFSGHYVSYVKNIENRWFKFDDSMVKEVDLQHVLTKGAYMLLYARCSPRAPRSIRSSLIHHHHDPRKHKIPSFVSKSHFVDPWDVCGYHPPRVHRSLEEESFSSDNSGFFSESCSCSTDSTHKDSSSIDDHISGDWEPDHHRNINFNSSDSDTSSSSSFSSPLYSRLSQLYTSTTNGKDDHKVSKICRNLDCSCNSCRITNLDRLGGRAPYSTSKPSVTFRRSTARGKSD